MDVSKAIKHEDYSIMHKKIGNFLGLVKLFEHRMPLSQLMEFVKTGMEWKIGRY